MSFRARIDKLAGLIGVGRLFGGEKLRGHLPEGDPANDSPGQQRADMAMACSSVAMHWILEPGELCARQLRAPTKEGRLAFDEMIAAANVQAAEIRDIAHVGADSTIDEVITGLLERCREEGFTIPELRRTREQMEAFVRRAEKNREPIGAKS